MTARLNSLIGLARNVRMTIAKRVAQWRSFAYGNTKIENERITKAMVDDAADSKSQQTATCAQGRGDVSALG